MLTLHVRPLHGQTPRPWRLVDSTPLVALRDIRYAQQPIVSGDQNTIVVADRDSLRVYIFDASGALRAVVRQTGAPPVPFASIGHLGITSDTIWVVDPTSRRLSLISRDGRPLSTFHVVLPLLGGEWTTIDLGARLPKGAVMAAPGIPEDASGQLTRAGDVPVLRLTVAGVVVDTIAWLNRAHSRFDLVTEDYVLRTRQPGSDDPLFAAARDGQSFVRVDRRAPSRAGPHTVTVTRLDSSGRKRFTREISYDAVALPDSIVRLWVSAITGRAHQRDSGIVRAALFAPPYGTPVSAVLIGRDQTLWLHFRYPWQKGGGHYAVLDSSGVLLADLPVQNGMTILDASLDYVWASVVTPRGYQVLRYRVLRGR